MDSHQLIFLQPVLDEQLPFLFGSHDHVFRDQLVLGDVDQQFGFQKLGRMSTLGIIRKYVTPLGGGVFYVLTSLVPRRAS